MDQILLGDLQMKVIYYTMFGFPFAFIARDQHGQGYYGHWRCVEKEADTYTLHKIQAEEIKTLVSQPLRKFLQQPHVLIGYNTEWWVIESESILDETLLPDPDFTLDSVWPFDIEALQNFLKDGNNV